MPVLGVVKLEMAVRIFLMKILAPLQGVFLAAATIFIFSTFNFPQFSDWFLAPLQSLADSHFYTIKDDASGGDCLNIGLWNSTSKTCTLESDLNKPIVISSDNVTLDGSGHKILGSGESLLPGQSVSAGSAGVFIKGRSGVTVKNLLVENFFAGIATQSSTNTTVESNTVKNNQYGIWVEGSVDPILNNNVVEQNQSFGIYFLLKSVRATLTGNEMNNNGKDLYLYGTLTLGGVGHEIDESNIVNGKKVFYFENLQDEIFNKMDMGVFYCVSCLNVIVKNTIIENKNENSIYLLNTDNSVFENLSVSGGSFGIRIVNSHNNTFTGSDLSGNLVAVVLKSGSSGNSFYRNNFYNNEIADVWDESEAVNSFSQPMPLGGNYWGKFDEAGEGCSDADGNLICDNSLEIKGVPDGVAGTDLLPWTERNAWPEACCSNVLFLPGLQASRLYQKKLISENKLWEPNINFDVEKLLLDETGQSLNPDIYTRDVIDEIYGTLGNIYKSFIIDMDEAVLNGEIKNWVAFPYDWRMDLEDIVNGQTKLAGGQTINLIEEVERLADNSITGEVIIVGHSNGGLVGKTLISELQAQGREDIIDKLVLVATPQLGTPKAIGGMLHGDDQQKVGGLVVKQSTARQLAENMPGAYNLLPSKKLTDIIAEDLVLFDNDSETTLDFRLAYGTGIAGREELDSFMLGNFDNRSKPATEDVATPNILNANLNSKSRSTKNLLDNWQAPENVDVYQIAGWGLETIKGIRYKDKEKIDCSKGSTSCEVVKVLDHRPIFTIEGDSTVVIPSADGGVGEKFYLNLGGFNTIFNINRNHGSILEVDPIRDLIDLIINSDSLEDLPNHISKVKPVAGSDDRGLLISAHSPVALLARNSEGQTTGEVLRVDPLVVSQNIPNSFYDQIGGGKYIGLNSDSSYDFEIRGEDYGSFTLEITELKDSQEDSLAVFDNIAVTPNLKAYLAVSENRQVGLLEIDVEGDGIIDLTYGYEDGNFEVNLAILVNYINGLEINEGIRNSIITRLENLEDSVDKENQLYNIKNFVIQHSGGFIPDDIAQNILKLLLLL